MLVSIYLVESQYSNGQTDLKLLEKKLLSLEEKFGHFLRYELSLLKMRDKLMQTMREQQLQNSLKAPKQIIVVEINKYFKTPGNGFNLAKLNDFGQ